MDNISKLMLFFLVNALGFLSVMSLFYIGMKSGVISTQNPDFNVEQFKMHFVGGTMLIWLVCALFSLAYFFVKGQARFVFLWAPFVVPMVYGLSSIF